MIWLCLLAAFAVTIAIVFIVMSRLIKDAEK